MTKQLSLTLTSYVYIITENAVSITLVSMKLTSYVYISQRMQSVNISQHEDVCWHALHPNWKAPDFMAISFLASRD